MQDFKGLEVWRRAHRLTLEVYSATRDFPSEERFGLTSQLRRSAVSIASNIAEGSGRGSDADFGRLLQIAVGSASELEYQLMLAVELGMLAAPEYARLDAEVNEVHRMLISFVRRLSKTVGQ